MNIKQLLFIINPYSGSGRLHYINKIESYFKPLQDFQIEFHKINWKDKPKKGILQKISDKSYDAIIACGGDGTVSYVAEVLYGKNIIMGILPTGSANGLAKNLNLPTAFSNALNIIREGYTQPVSSITVNEYFCIHLADIGLNAAIIKQFDKENRRGFLGYLQAFRTVYFGQRKVQGILSFNNRSVKTRFYMLVFCNGTGYGTGLNINPDGRFDDFKFEVVNVKKLSLLEIFRLFLGKEKPNPAFVKIVSIDEIQVELPKKVHLQVDGEYLGKIKEVKAKMNDKFIEFLVPGE
ncbi:hypothetical protein GO491_07455 [Flavobacteriaceae bacterium Ap0902]|nr:hypothetical protein [Flavobacteriaceae bacterium Ap0902]